MDYVLKDSGERQTFKSGATRDIQKGKGRFDLLPFEVFQITDLYMDRLRFWDHDFLRAIENFKRTGDVKHLQYAARLLHLSKFDGDWEFVESLAKHFEAGAVKYGDDNWRLGLPASRYIDSALRHFFKLQSGHDDEPHKTATAWNIICCLWTCVNKPEFNDYTSKIRRI